jgi:hypothetical protein
MLLIPTGSSRNSTTVLHALLTEMFSWSSIGDANIGELLLSGERVLDVLQRCLYCACDPTADELHQHLLTGIDTPLEDNAADLFVYLVMDGLERAIRASDGNRLSEWLVTVRPSGGVPLLARHGFHGDLLALERIVHALHFASTTLSWETPSDDGDDLPAGELLGDLEGYISPWYQEFPDWLAKYFQLLPGLGLAPSQQEIRIAAADFYRWVQERLEYDGVSSSEEDYWGGEMEHL